MDTSKAAARRPKRWRALGIAGLIAVSLVVFAPRAEAGAHVSVGIGIGVPVFGPVYPYPYPVYYPPYPVYAPPVVYAPVYPRYYYGPRPYWVGGHGHWKHGGWGRGCW